MCLLDEQIIQGTLFFSTKFTEIIDRVLVSHNNLWTAVEDRANYSLRMPVSNIWFCFVFPLPSLTFICFQYINIAYLEKKCNSDNHKNTGLTVNPR